MKYRLFATAAFCTLLLCTVRPAPVNAAQPESRLYGELRSTMQVRSYPQAIVLADQLLKAYPLTLYKESVLLMKGESLFRLGRYDESIDTVSTFAGKSYGAAYWCGRSWYEKGEYTKAANYFQGAVTLIQLNKIDVKDAETESLLQSSLVYAAQSCANIGETDTAVQLLEYTFANHVLTIEKQRALILLFSLYSQTGDCEKTLGLYEQTAEFVEQFPEKIRDSIKASVVKAYGVTNTDPESQWNLCLSLLDSGDEETVLSALSYAYSLAEKSETYDVSQVLDKAEPFLKNRSQYRSELCLRLGVEASSEGNYDKALEYYNRALATADNDQRGCIVLYMADCYQQKKDPGSATSVLKQALLLDSSFALDITVTLVQQYLSEGNEADAFACADRLWQLYTRYPEHELAVTALFYHAWLYGRRGDWKTVEVELSPLFATDSDLSPEIKILYGQSLIHRAAVSDEAVLKQAETLFRQAVSALDETENRTSARENLAVVHLMQGRYSSAYSVARTESRLNYIAGLGALGTGNWQTAANLLGTDSVWGVYYTAYARYQSGNTREAQTLFTRFCRENPTHIQCRTAWNYIALCAVQNDDQKAALQAAEKCYNLSVTDAQKTEAALLWAELYASGRQYDKAIALLQPLAKQRTKNAVQIRFSLADLYSANGDVSSAVQLLLDTQSAYYDDATKEESLYRLAELYYRQNRFAEAAARFESCRKNYPSGTYAQQALYYNALCLDQTGDRQSKETAVLLYTMVTQSDKNSPYLFASWARLAVLNRELGSYGLALEAIEQAVRLSPKEAASLDFGNLKKQVQLLMNGEEERTVALVSEYEANNGEKTEKGRSIGVELSRRYLASASTRNQGAETLKKITAAIKENTTSVTDRKSAAEAWSLLGVWQRQELLLADSVDSFVNSASFWAGINTQSQEEQLFNAIKSLDELGRIADCRQVLTKMKEIDSRSSWVEQAEKMLENYY